MLFARTFRPLIIALVAFMPLAASSWADCTSPAGGVGRVIYASNYNMMVYCDGTNWRSMAGGVSQTINTSGGASVAGTDTQIQYNNGGVLAASAGLTWTNASSLLTATNISTTNVSASVASINSLAAGTITAGTISTTGVVSAVGIYAGPYVQLTSDTTACAVGQAGRISYANNSLTYCNGTAWTSLSSNTTAALADRITSGTSAAIINSSTGITSLSTAGTTWGYLGSAMSYLPGLTSTNISATTVQLASDTTACSSAIAGRLSYVSGSVLLCNGTSWSNVGIGVPAGTISAFASSSCPAGWTEYTPARGRFLRGIDNGAGLDPNGTRAPGNQQADALQNITGNWRSFAAGTGSGAGGMASSVETANTLTYTAGGVGYNHDIFTFDASRMARTAAETRPSNVAVTFCQYTGIGGGGGGSVSVTAVAAGNTTDVQYNNGGVMAGSDNFAWNNGSNLLTVTGSISASGGVVAGPYVQLTSDTTACAAGQAGRISYANNSLTYCNGTAWTSLSSNTTAGMADRIVSGTNVAVINSTTGIISLSTTSGTSSWGYLAPTGLSYLPGLFANQVSSTNVSLTVSDYSSSSVAITNLVGSGGNQIVSGTSNVTVNGGLINTVSFTTGGTQRMVLTNTGLGISVTTPAYALDVGGGVRATGEIIAMNSNQLRMVNGNYGAILRNDGSDTYILMTASGDQYGTWTSYRPLRINNSGNLVQIGGGGSYPTNLQVGGNFDTTAGYVHASSGYKSQPGANQTPGGNLFNINWTASNAQLWIDNTNIGNITVSSDRRVKHDIATLPETSGLAALSQINPVSFHWNDKKSGTELQYGFIAQEVRKVFPNLVRNTGMKTKATPDGLLRVEYNGFFAPIVKGIQELKALFDTDHAALVELQQQNAALRALVAKQGAAIDVLLQTNPAAAAKVEQK